MVMVTMMSMTTSIGVMASMLAVTILKFVDDVTDSDSDGGDGSDGYLAGAGYVLVVNDDDCSDDDWVLVGNALGGGEWCLPCHNDEDDGDDEDGHHDDADEDNDVDVGVSMRQ